MRGPATARLLALALAGAVAIGAQTPPPLVFDARVESVYVDAFVTRDGQPVLGLRAEDFELTDQGVVQQLEPVASDAVPLVAVLAFDTSSSVTGPRLAALQAAGEAFLDGLRPADEAALLTFDEEVRWASEPTRDRARVKAALAAIEPRGATAALDGLYAAIALPSAQARFLVVLFSDGQDNASWLAEAQVKRVAERSNALIHVVGFAPTEPNPLVRGSALGHTAEPLAYNRGLRQIAEATGGTFWPADSPARLRQAFAAIAEAMSRRYVLRFEPRGKAVPGWHALELKLRGRSGQVQARRGYWVER